MLGLEWLFVCHPRFLSRTSMLVMKTYPHTRTHTYTHTNAHTHTYTHTAGRLSALCDCGPVSNTHTHTNSHTHTCTRQDGSALFVTVAQYQTPEGTTIDLKGLHPDRACQSPDSIASLPAPPLKGEVEVGRKEGGGIEALSSTGGCVCKCAINFV